MLNAYANNEGAHLPISPHSLISPFTFPPFILIVAQRMKMALMQFGINCFARLLWVLFVHLQNRRILKYMSTNREYPDQTAQRRTLIWTFAVCIWHKVLFPALHFIYEPAHDKTSRMACAPSEDSNQSGNPPSLIRVFAVGMKKAWILSYQFSAQRRLW